MKKIEKNASDIQIAKTGAARGEKNDKIRGKSEKAKSLEIHTYDTYFDLQLKHATEVSCYRRTREIAMRAKEINCLFLFSPTNRDKNVIPN